MASHSCAEMPNESVSMAWGDGMRCNAAGRAIVSMKNHTEVDKEREHMQYYQVYHAFRNCNLPRLN